MTIGSDPDMKDRCSMIELLILDVDGVLTDGVIAVDDRGVETKHFHVRDGAGIASWRRAGKKVAIISGRSAPAVEVRAAELGIAPVHQGVPEKSVAFRSILEEFGLVARQVCTIGDDLADLEILGLSGLSACPADAAYEVAERVDHVTRADGGRGAVREVVELILNHQGVWPSIVDRFLGHSDPSGILDPGTQT